MRKTRLALFSVLPILCIAAILAAPSFSRGKKALTFEDVMKFRAIKDPALSDDGRWIAFAAEPDRGDGEALVQSAGGAPVYRLERGSRPVFSKNSRWAAAVVKPSFAEAEKARAPGQKGSEPRPGLAILDTQTGEWKKHDKVDRFAFSDDSRWIALTLFKEEKKETATEPSKEKAESAKKKAEIGSTLQIVDLSGPRTFEIPFVGLFAFSPDSRYLAYTAQKPEGRGNGLYYRELGKDPGAEAVIARADDGRYSGLNWSEAGARLAFLAAPGADDGSDAAPASLHIWSGDSRTLQSPAVRLEQGWILPLKNDLTWTKDGKRLFFGRKPAPEAAEKADAGKDDPPGIYDLAVILKKREGDVWHWNDPRIVTQQKQMWSRVKDRTYRAVYHTDSEKVVALADPSLPDVQVSENAARALGSSDVPYLKEITWDGNFSDIYVIGLSDGSRKKVVERLAGRPSMSPQGRYVAYYLDRHWHLFDAESGTARNLTEPLGVTFADEDHDTPDDPPGYGVAGWTDSDEGVLINDKFDIWHFTTASGAAQNLTAGRGRREARIFRALRTDPEKTAWTKGETVLLSAYSDRDKSHGFYAGRIGQPGVEKRLEGNKRFRFLQKSKDADAIMFTRESYAEFPDLWVADSGFAQPGKLTEVNPQMSEFAWGDAELVDWHSLDGVPLQGVLIKPGNYEPGKRYPVIVYYYELSSQRLYEFNQPVVNHRPCFPYYTSNGYALFLPDVRYEIGRPGLSATKCLVPGVQKLIDMGVADPERIGLHGHSWSGYQTAFVITQSHIFAAAIAGAPVSNMTSAYSGIRWESGLARQFQYEKTQSRIGATLWQAPYLYLENSPVFFSDRIRTPLLIQFGDEDGAVPWYQGIELYLAMRRLGKDCIFLQYHGEPHHLQKYPNKLDYAMKMKEYFDHYLKGLPAADWIRDGVPYQGK